MVDRNLNDAAGSGKFGDPRIFEKVFAGLPVLVTGHTGFTGSWLSLWLHAIGAEIYGIALEPVTRPNLFSAAGVGDVLHSTLADIRDSENVTKVFAASQPVVVFHLAAQPLVSQAFRSPLETMAINIQGTANVLEAARQTKSVKAVVVVTTDKVYADKNWHWGYRETDELGGKDPYSASKAAAEIVALSYRKTLAERGNGVRIATARGGNIIGGGDWSDDRIVPDFVRAVINKSALSLRNPAAVRPWQHVLALVHGYLTLAAALMQGEQSAADAWNFGPVDDDAKTVQTLVDALAKSWMEPGLEFVEGGFPETHFLHLDSTKARTGLGWKPGFRFAETVEHTAAWYRDFHSDPSSARHLTESQIANYRQSLMAQKNE